MSDIVERLPHDSDLIERLKTERDEAQAKYRKALDHIIDLECQLGESLIELSEKSGV